MKLRRISKQTSGGEEGRYRSIEKGVWIEEAGAGCLQKLPDLVCVWRGGGAHAARNSDNRIVGGSRTEQGTADSDVIHSSGHEGIS